MGSVAKIIIRVEGFGEPAYLLSRKRAKGTPKHGKLEFLGGGTDGDDPFTGLVRELEEEEKSGTLASMVSSIQPSARLVRVDGTPHYIFEVTITVDEYLELRHGRKESLGFKVVPQSMVRTPQIQARLTGRTRGILAALDLA